LCNIYIYERTVQSVHVSCALGASEHWILWSSLNRRKHAIIADVGYGALL